MREATDILRIIGIILLGIFVLAVGIPLVLTAAGIALGIVGILFGIPSLRIKGLYLAVATLAAQFFFDWLFIRIGWFTANSGGTPW